MGRSKNVIEECRTEEVKVEILQLVLVHFLSHCIEICSRCTIITRICNRSRFPYPYPMFTTEYFPTPLSCSAKYGLYSRSLSYRKGREGGCVDSLPPFLPSSFQHKVEIYYLLHTPRTVGDAKSQMNDSCVSGSPLLNSLTFEFSWARVMSELSSRVGMQA